MPVVIDTSTGVEPTPVSGRQTFPNAEDRLVYSIEGGSDFRPSVGRKVRIYSDAAGTVLADIQNPNGTPVANSELTVDANSLLPTFLGPDGVDTLYAKGVGSSAVAEIHADTDSRLDSLQTSLSAVVTGSGFVTTGSLVVNVKDFGAIGNGVANDTAAIQAAINASTGSVYFPPGTYLTNSTITLKSNLNITGAGAIIKHTAAAELFSANNVTKVVFDGLSFAGPKRTDFVFDTYNHAIVFFGSSFVKVVNCHFDGFEASTVKLVGCNNSIISNNTFNETDGHDVSGGDYGSIGLEGQSRDCIITGNTFHKFRSTMVSLYTCSYNVISNNRGIGATAAEFGSGVTGFYCLNGSTYNQFNGNNVENVMAEGVVINNSGGFANSSYNSVVGNTFKDCGYAGVNVEASAGIIEGTVITNNHISSSIASDGRHGVVLLNADFSVVSGNLFLETGVSRTSFQDGIVMINSSHRASLTGNTFIGLKTGIGAAGIGTVISSNVFADCATGISIFFCVGVPITGNSFTNGGTGIVFGPSSDAISLVNNIFINTNAYNGTPSSTASQPAL